VSVQRLGESAINKALLLDRSGRLQGVTYRRLMHEKATSCYAPLCGRNISGSDCHNFDLLQSATVSSSIYDADKIVISRYLLSDILSKGSQKLLSTIRISTLQCPTSTSADTTQIP
jgi:hypothetical protein